MIALSLVACLIAHPQHCKEVRGFRQPESMIECLTATQVAAAEWAREHPGWRVKRIKCTLGNRAPDLHA